MSPAKFKLVLAVLALSAAAVGAGAAYLLVKPRTQAGASVEVGLSPSLSGAGRVTGTPTGWRARVSTIAGDGLPGSSNGLGRRTRFADPFGVVLDLAGNLYVADGGDNNTIRKIGLDGVGVTLAGALEGDADGVGRAAAFNTPSGLAIDAAGTLYVADTGNNAIRKVAPDGTVSTLAGGRAAGAGAAAAFNGPVGVAVDAAGVVYVADTYNDRIRRIAVNGEVTTIAGGGRAGLVDGPAAQARFDTPTGLALAANGDLYIADTGNDAIRKLSKDGVVSTVAVAKDDERDALLRQPVGLALTADGFLYVGSNAHGRLAQITPAGEVVGLIDADHPAEPGYGADGGVRLYAPRGIALYRDGSLFVTDGATCRLHHIGPALPGSSSPADEPAVGAPAHGATMLWPLKPQDQAHEVVGVMGEVRGNFSGESRDHFHSGLDVQGAIGAPVLAVAAGKVSDPHASWGYGELSEGVRFGGLQYVHLRVGRDPRDKIIDPRFQLLRDDKGAAEAVRVKRGTRFAAGDTLGTINRMAHVHLDYKPNGDLLNPLSLPFIDLEDTIAPTIERITVTDAQGRALSEKAGGRLLLRRSLGQVQIVVEAYDQINGGQARRRLGLFKLGYQLLNAEGEVIPGMREPIITQLYDKIPRNREAVKLAYAADSGITVHGSKQTRFSYAINQQLAHGRLTPGALKLGPLGSGDYTLRITAEDYAGNAAVKGRDLAITID